MITKDQLEQLSRKYKTNSTVVAREYLQLLFLQNFYELRGSEKVYFKGGTAIHFLMEGFRFSEDLDFTTEVSQQAADDLVIKAADKVKEIAYGLSLKEKKSLVGGTYLLTLPKSLVAFPIFVRLDFSFRESILQRKRGLVKTDFPVIFTSFVHYLGEEEIIAEKARAILTRNKPRDFFDLWYLLSKGFGLNEKFVKTKMSYYPKVIFSWKRLKEKVSEYGLENFKKDLVPFLSVDKRAKIEETFEIIKFQLLEKLPEG